MKVLISWIGFTNDFEKDQGGKVKEDGPTFNFYRHFYKDYDCHYLLSSGGESDLKTEFLANALQNAFKGRNVIAHQLPISDPINVAEIGAKIDSFLLGLDADAIDVFVSPGTPAMQTAWYMAKMNLDLPIRLLQTRAAVFTADKKPELIVIDLERSNAPVTAILSSKVLGKKASKDEHLITPSLQKVYDRASKVAQTDAVHTLIKGETGSGKEHLAHFIHAESERREKNFVAINCAAISDELLYSQLFGHKKGSFTGADNDHNGFFQEAHGGTIFLDEIGDISSRMQQALLRVVQSGEIIPQGATKPTKVDVRVVAASHADLPSLCKEGRFRWDLYYRLAVVELELPPLRMRGASEIWDMVEHLNKRAKKELRKTDLLHFSATAKQAMLNYAWPGNIRELENLIRRLYVFEEGEVTTDHLPERLNSGGVPESLLLEDAIQRHVEMVLRIKEGNQRQTALALGIALNTLKKRIG